MDDFTIYGLSFGACLESLSRVLDRCIETDLVLNFEKCHFMVIECKVGGITHKLKRELSIRWLKDGSGGKSLF